MSRAGPYLRAVDRFLDYLRDQRNALELEIARLRDQRETLNQDLYYQRLEGLLVELARLYEQIEKGGVVPAESGDPRP